MNIDELRIAFGTTVLRHGSLHGGLDGIGHYTKALRQCLLASQGIQVREFSYSPAATEEMASASVAETGHFSLQASLAILFGSRFRGFDSLLKEGVDVVHATDHLVPHLRDTPTIATIMDVIPLSHPHLVDYPLKHLKNWAWKRSLKWADRIITISEYSKSEIIRHLDVEDSKVDVVPLGVDAEWFTQPNEATLGQVAERHALPDQYLLFVGTLQPRKNIWRLLEAHRALPEDMRREYPLLIAGRYGWGEPKLLEQLRDPSDPAIRWLNYFPAQDLKHLVAGATAMVFPSLIEGFGLPLLEAFAAGTPVVASNSTSIPEVAGDAAILIDPESVASIKLGIEQILMSESLQARCINRGKQRAAVFTWERTAELTLASYERLLSAK